MHELASRAAVIEMPERNESGNRVVMRYLFAFVQPVLDPKNHNRMRFPLQCTLGAVKAVTRVYCES